MTIIKKIIFWIIELIRSLFRKENKDVVIKTTGKINKPNKKGKGAYVTYTIDETFPSFMIINNGDKDKLLYNISLLKNYIEEARTKIKEQEEKKLTKEIEEKYNIKTSEILDRKYLESVIKELNSTDKKAIIDKYDNITKRDKEFKVHLDKIDKVIEEINNKDISIIEENEIKREISTITNDKNIDENIEQKVDYFTKNVDKIINEVDDYFLRDVIREYQKVNYVTVSTTIIDKNIERFKKLEEDFRHHRYNKYYYEREINQLKNELKQIKDLKNKKEVSEHIEKLKKELYTKSKDKYDLLYNNEVFMNFEKECDNLLHKINAKVIDIKKEEVVKEEKPKDVRKKEEYLENILLRFKDMELAQELILLAQKNDNEAIKSNIYDYVRYIYQKYDNGIDADFNFSRNKKKTELVILFNELNLAIGNVKKEEFITVDHINFRMQDLVEAVDVKKQELDTIVGIKESELGDKVDNKIKSLMPNNPKEMVKNKSMFNEKKRE